MDDPGLGKTNPHPVFNPDDGLTHLAEHFDVIARYDTTDTTHATLCNVEVDQGWLYVSATVPISCITCLGTRE